MTPKRKAPETLAFACLATRHNRVAILSHVPARIGTVRSASACHSQQTTGEVDAPRPVEIPVRPVGGRGDQHPSRSHPTGKQKGPRKGAFVNPGEGVLDQAWRAFTRAFRRLTLRAATLA